LSPRIWGWTIGPSSPAGVGCTMTRVMRGSSTHRLIVIVSVMLTLTILLLAGRGVQVVWSDTKLRLMAPRDPSAGVETNSLVSSPGGLVATAGAVVAQIDPKPAVPRMASPNVNIVDIGIARGVWVRIPDSGGQWQNSFSDPIIQIQVSGPTEADVANRTEQAIEAARRSLSELQDGYAVNPAYRITIEKDLYGTRMFDTGPSRMRLRAGILMLGAWLTAAASIVVRGSRRGTDRTVTSTSSAPVAVR